MKKSETTFFTWIFITYQTEPFRRKSAVEFTTGTAKVGGLPRSALIFLLNSSVREGYYKTKSKISKGRNF